MLSSGGGSGGGGGLLVLGMLLEGIATIASSCCRVFNCLFFFSCIVVAAK